MTELTGDSPAAAPQGANSNTQGANKINQEQIQNALAGLKNIGWSNEEASKKPKYLGIVLNLTLPLIPIIIGAIFMDDCPVEPMIPIWAVVNGSMTIISSALELFVLLRGDHHKKTAGLVRLIHVFLPIWFIVGCVYVYRNYEPSYDEPVGEILDDDMEYVYCHKVMYQFAFWYLTAYFIAALVGIFICCCCCCCGFAACLKKIGLSMNNKTDVETVTPAQMEAAPEKA